MLLGNIQIYFKGATRINKINNVVLNPIDVAEIIFNIIDYKQVIKKKYLKIKYFVALKNGF